MTAFAITFSERYRLEAHPLAEVWPDGYVRVEAAGIEEAEIAAYRHFNAYFDAVIPEIELDESAYPLGCLFTV